MTRWLTVFACMTLLPAAAATAQRAASLAHPTEISAQSHRPTFRLIEQSPTDPGPIRQSGMIVDTRVGENTTLGLGLFSVTKKRGFNDVRPDPSGPRSRKIGIGLKIRF